MKIIGQKSVMMYFVWKSTCVWLIIWYNPSQAQQDVGDSCKVARTGGRGTCKIIDDCPTVINEIVKLSLYPTSCGFVGHKQIVCCPSPPSATTTTPPPIITRISQRSKSINR